MNCADRGQGPKFKTTKSLKRPPKDISEGAAAVWRELAGPLVDEGVITVVDVRAFRELCEMSVQRDRAHSELEMHGVVVPSAREDGGLVKNPAWSIFKDATDRLNQLRSRFGLTPADRGNGKVQVERKPKTESKWDRFKAPARYGGGVRS